MKTEKKLMKIIFTLLLFLQVNSLLLAQGKYQNEVFPYEENGKYGLMDYEGNTIMGC